MIGQIIYHDGTSEPIFVFDEYNTYCGAITPSGKYVYRLVVHQADNGIKYARPEVYYYDRNKHEWFRDESIKEFQINKEN